MHQPAIAGFQPKLNLSSERFSITIALIPSYLNFKRSFHVVLSQMKDGLADILMHGNKWRFQLINIIA